MFCNNPKIQTFTVKIRRLLALIMFTGLFTVSAFAQDVDSVSVPWAYKPIINRFSVGTNFIQTGTGTLNLLVNYKFLYLSEVQVGVGYLPFRKYFDAVNNFYTSQPLIDTSFSNGFYLNAGLNWIIKSQIKFIDNCISIDWRKWYFMEYDGTNHSKTRYSFSYGKRILINPLLSIEGSIGPTVVNFQDNGIEYDSYLGVDFGLVVNIHLVKEKK